MTERSLIGSPASPGVALGVAWRASEQAATAQIVPVQRRDEERRTAVAALASAAEQLAAVASELPAAEAEIVETGVLMARDPALASAVEDAIVSSGLTAAEAILIATGEHAAAIAALGDQTLAARADDVRSLGRRAARLAGAESAHAPPGTDVILIAPDLGPADVAELASVLAGIALVGGGPTAHAAIVARSLGIPMVTGVGADVLGLPDGTRLALDGTVGSLTVEPSHPRARKAAADMASRRLAARRTREERDQPAATIDGRRITVLVNVATAAELEVALEAGAEGIGLLRTELAFLDAADWPTEQDHTDAVKPILTGLGDRPAIVRVLDFGADKSPPFLREVSARGLELLLEHPDALIAQLRALVHCGSGRDLRIMLPMVDSLEQLEASRSLLARATRELGVSQPPPLGSMIETPLAVDRARSIARGSAFLSVGTNDLTATTLGADRFAANTACAHHPLVLRSIARAVAAAHEAGIAIEVCGEAASDPLMLPLLVGLGVDQVSVGAAQVGAVRSWIRQLSADNADRLARSALEMDSIEEVESSVANERAHVGV